MGHDSRNDSSIYIHLGYMSIPILIFVWTEKYPLSQIDLDEISSESPTDQTEHDGLL